MNERIENVPKLQRALSAGRLELERLQTEKVRLLDLYNTLDLPALLRSMVDTLEQRITIDGYMVTLANDTREHLVCEALRLPKGFEELQATFSRFRFPIDGSDEFVRAFLERSVVNVSKKNLGELSVYTQSAFFNWRISSMLVLPIVVDMDDDGVVAIGSFALFRADDDFTEEDANLALSTVEEHAPPIRNAQYFQRLEHKEEYLAHAQDEQFRFLEFITRINALTRPESIFGLISDEFLRRFPFHVVSVLLAENERLHVKHVQASKEIDRSIEGDLLEVFKDQSYRLKNSDGASPTAYLQNSPFYIDDIPEIINLPMSRLDRQGLEVMQGARTMGIIPIRHREKAIGVLWLASVGSKAMLSDAEKNLIEALCGFIGRAIANTKLYALVESQKVKIEGLNQRLQEKVVALNEAAAKDKLTGLFNFGSFQKEITRRMSETARQSDNEGLSIVLLDVDNFKKFNDTYGHLAGNDVLKEVAERIKSVARSMDIPCRYGGEEFVLILPRCPLEGALGLADRVRNRVAELPFFVNDKGVLVTASLGCATFRPGESAEAFIERADKALYAAKANGKNRVEAEETV